MLDTVRSFAIRWLLEPTEKEPPTPSKRVIKFVTAWLDPPNKFDTDIDCDWQEWRSGPTNYDEYELVYHDNLSMMQGRILGIKIYDDNKYIGAFSQVYVQRYYTSCINGHGKKQIINKFICDYSQRTHWDEGVSETVSYSINTQISKASEWQKSRATYKNCPFEVSPILYFGHSGAAFDLNDPRTFSGYSQYEIKRYECNIKPADISAPVISVKPSETYIAVSCVNDITETWEIVNLKNESGEWVNGSNVINQTSQDLTGGFVMAIDDKHIKPDLKSAEIKIEYDEDGEEISCDGPGWYTAYYDGLTPEIMSEYAAIARSYDGSKIEVIMGTET